MSDTSKQIASVLRKLETRGIVSFMEEQRLGKPVYDALLEQLRNASLSKNQTANALVVLFQLRALGVEPVFEAVMTALAHPHVVFARRRLPWPSD
jgi:hypothetical protein